MKMAIIFFLLFAVCNCNQFPFLNFDIPSFSNTPFGIPSISNPFSDQKDELPMASNNILEDLRDVPMNIMNDGKNIKTSKQTKVKDGYKITTINKTAPGFFSYMSEVQNDGNKANGSKFDFSSTLMNAGNLFGMLNGGSMKKKCGKKCPADKFCDPMFGKCRSKLSEGSACMLINQCVDGLRCVWGRCNKGKAGDPGTFCKRKNQCSKDACCIKQEDSFHAMCVPPFDEGAICGQKISDLFMNTLSPERNIKAKQCNPCKSGLKCGDVGDPKNKRCVSESYVEQSKEAQKVFESLDQQADDKEENKGNSSGDKDDKDDGSDNDDNDDDDEVVDDIGSIPVKTTPKRKSKNKKTSDNSKKIKKQQHN